MLYNSAMALIYQVHTYHVWSGCDVTEEVDWDASADQDRSSKTGESFTAAATRGVSSSIKPDHHPPLLQICKTLLQVRTETLPKAKEGNYHQSIALHNMTQNLLWQCENWQWFLEHTVLPINLIILCKVSTNLCLSSTEKVVHLGQVSKWVENPFKACSHQDEGLVICAHKQLTRWYFQLKWVEAWTWKQHSLRHKLTRGWLGGAHKKTILLSNSE